MGDLTTGPDRAVDETPKVSRIPLVYVAGPYRASSPWLVEQNIRRAEEVAASVWESGAACICPHANTRHFDKMLPDAVFLEGCLEMVRRSDAVITVPGWSRSVGSMREISEAQGLGIPVFDALRELQEWLRATSETA